MGWLLVSKLFFEGEGLLSQKSSLHGFQLELTLRQTYPLYPFWSSLWVKPKAFWSSPYQKTMKVTMAFLHCQDLIWTILFTWHILSKGTCTNSSVSVQIPCSPMTPPRIWSIVSFSPGQFPFVNSQLFLDLYFKLFCLVYRCISRNLVFFIFGIFRKLRAASYSCRELTIWMLPILLYYSTYL